MMKLFRDLFAAILVGIMGGLLVSTISYYHDHKEGGLTQTLFAILNSFDTVTTAYSDEEGDSLYAKMDTYNMEKQVLEAFESLENGEESDIYQSLLNQLLDSQIISGTKGDILAMEDENGGIDEGEPYSGILRFHVRANSDSAEDQALKIAVKDDVVTMLKPLLEECGSVAESKSIIVSNLQNIYTMAVNTIVEQGYDYEVKVYVTEEEFPAKTYGDLTFPAGRYQALRIDIGKAEGQNWWCVMYPPLCFMDGSTVVVSEENKEKLKENMTPKEYAELFGNAKIKGESWLYNLIKGN